MPAESECQIFVPLPWRNGKENPVPVIDACPEPQMPYLRPYLLRARNGAASKAEVRQESPLQVAEADGKNQLTGIIVDLAASAVG